MSTSDLSDIGGEVSPSVSAARTRAVPPPPGHVEDAKGGLPATGAEGVVKLVGAATGHAAASRAATARMVADAIESTHTRQAAQAASRSSFLRETAASVRAAAEKAAKDGTRAGGRVQLKGHFIERLDVATYNAKNRLTGKKLVPLPNSRHPAYDARRFIKGKFAGAIQQKSSAAGTEKAIAQIEKVKPGSASRATLRVPKDEAARAHARARGRIRVSEMEFTSAQAGRKLDRGIDDLARSGVKATSTARALARGAAVGAAVTPTLGAAGDARALRRRDMSVRDFAENRAVDAAEGAANAFVGMGAMAASGTTVIVFLGTPAGVTAAGAAGAAGTAALGAVGGMGAAGAAAAGVLGGVTVATAAPFVVGTAAAIGSGVLVSKGFKCVRNGVRAHQQQRRARASEESAVLALPAAELDENGAPITDAVIVDIEELGRVS